MLPRVGVQHLLEGAAGAVQEAGLAEVGAQRGQRVRALGAREVAPGEQRLVDLDRALHLAGLAQQVAQHLQHLDRLRVLARDLGQLADGELGWPAAR